MVVLLKPSRVCSAHELYCRTSFTIGTSGSIKFLLILKLTVFVKQSPL
nr:MAG TPA: hypothetical protein [Bacteriophage sp.]